MKLDLETPFEASAALGNLRVHTIPGSEVIEGDTLHRLVPHSEGDAHLSVTIGAEQIELEIHDAGARSELELTALVRRWLDLDAAPDRIGEALGGDPIVGDLVRQRPGLRVLGSLDPFETAAMTVIGQQVSLAAARTFGGRLVETFGVPHPSGLRRFPRSEEIAAAGEEAIRAAVGLTGARARTLHGLAVAVAAGDTDLDGGSDERFRASLLALFGIGPWTVDYLTLRLRGDRDAFVPGDLVLRKALTERLGEQIDTRRAEQLSQSWRPERAVALMHLWTASAYAP